VRSRVDTAPEMTSVRGRSGRASRKVAGNIVSGDMPNAGRTLHPRHPAFESNRSARTLTPTVSVIIPTLNEAANIPFVLNTIPRWVDEVVVVDGRSRDDTERVARVLRPDVQIVKQVRRGKGAALQDGLNAAKGDLLIIMDADGSMDGADIAAFKEALIAGADYVKGSRFCAGGGSADITRLRRFGDRGICMLVHLFFGARYTDGTYGFKGLWADCLDAVHIDTDGFEVELLIDIRAHRAGLKIAEVPCFETLRIHGKSNLNAARDGLRCLRVILNERFRRYGAAAL
jgi:glycosyltransferase involved in cell wall biosynthesis